VRDPIHGFVEFNDLEKEIIKHPVFQRLRRIKQLALTELVYPGATHTRFEHSLGVLEVASQMFNSICYGERKSEEILRNYYHYDGSGLERQEQIIRLAALLHDIGHGPFSHGGEGLFPKKDGDEHYSHEDYTVALIKGPLRDTIENNKDNVNFGINADEIANLIEGDPRIGGQKLFWRSIISSQFDADRADYLLRDSYHIGVKYGIYDLARILGTVSIGINPETEDPIIGIRVDGWHNAEAMILARYQFFTQVVFHDVRRAYDIMLRQALRYLEGEYPTLDNLDAFIKLDDYKIWSLMLKSDDYWSQAILSRKHLRSVWETESVSENDGDKIQTIIEKFEGEDIEYYIDESNKPWYELNGAIGEEEIMVIDRNNQTHPLSHHSRLMDKLQNPNFIRVYVKKEDEPKAKAAINGLGL
jgi:HD superfamily phosphohydrolase